MNQPLAEVSAQGVSIWLDDLSRERITSGSLAAMVKEQSVVGVTTNPSIFAAALSKAEIYGEALAACAQAGNSVEEAVFTITTDDVRSACDIFTEVFTSSKGLDGRVSIEVDPRLARDMDATVAEAKRLWATVNRPNAMIKIPATVEGLPAISAVLAEGISVNVTLIFSIERYRAVMDAYMTGLERAAAAGHDLAKITSVASFFVSRVDTEIDKRLKAIGSDEALALAGKAGIANARLAYAAFEEVFAGARWQALEAQGANKQRPLWASTGVKDPAYRDTMYVVDLVAPGIVNTMPEGTLKAVADHGVVAGDTIHGHIEQAAADIAALAALGIQLDEVTDLLEVEGVSKFDASWDDLLADVKAGLERHA